MRLINKNTPPASFQHYIKQKGASYKEIDDNVKVDLKKSLLEEQDYLCAYCQQKININNMKIEHHCEQSICNGTNGQPDRRLDYTNLFAVCAGKAGKVLHCDSMKATDEDRKHLPIDLLPTQKPHIATISYKGSGLLASSNNKFDLEIDAVLNLNTPMLKELRKKRWNSIFKNSKNDKVKRLRLLKKEIDKKSSFTGMFEYMLKK
jgi:uncharacterized protein (TIGR02646 family)